MTSGGHPATIVVQATPFCYGPAAIGLAIAKELRRQAAGSIRLVGLSEQTSYELFATSDAFDRVYHWRLDEIGDGSAPATSELLGATVVVSVADFDLAKEIAALGRRAVVVDPLYWMWDEDPVRLSLCRDYYVMDYPGVERRVAEQRRRHPHDPAPIVVEPVCEPLDAAPDGSPERTLLISLGGMHCPLGCNLDLAHAMAERALRAALSVGLHDAVSLCGGSEPLASIARRLGAVDPRMKVGSLGQAEYFQRLVACTHLAVTPGLSSVFEATRCGRRTLVLLGMNYSQHRQSAVWPEVTRHGSVLQWEDFDGYSTLPPGLPEEVGVQRSFELGTRFARDAAALDRFEELFAAFLRSGGPGIELRSERAGRLEGAARIAAGVLRRAAA